jgi:hypothetical protein
MSVGPLCLDTQSAEGCCQKKAGECVKCQSFLSSHFRLTPIVAQALTGEVVVPEVALLMGV